MSRDISKRWCGAGSTTEIALKAKVSLPEPSVSVSAPKPPVILSFLLWPKMMSSADVPMRVSAFELPRIASLLLCKTLPARSAASAV